MEDFDISSSTNVVLLSTFLIALLFGAVSQRTHFCTMGAIADIVNFGDWARMRMWGLAIAVATLGLQLMSTLGMANLDDTIYMGGQWPVLSALLGGLLFGFGMVLASGCGSKTLIRLGAGNLKALVVFLVIGLTGYMTLKGIFGVIRFNVLDPVRIDLGPTAFFPAMLSDSETVQTVVRFLIPGALLAWVVASPSGRNKEVLLGGVGVGLSVLLVWYVVFQMSFVAEHPDTLEQAYLGSYANRAEGFSFVAPYSYTLEWLMFFSDASRVITVGVVACLGVVLGAFLMAKGEKSFRWESFNGVEDMGNHLAGGAMMGIGGVMAMGCTVGQGLSGVSTLSLTSWLTLGFIILGGWLGLKYQIWRLERMA